MEIYALTSHDALWEPLAAYAAACSWRAGPTLARLMRGGEFLPWERVFVAREGDEFAGYCTFAEKDCLEGVDYTPFIGFVFVGEDYRGQRLSERLIRAALAYAKTLGYSKVYLTSGEKGLYEKYGFIKFREMRDKYGTDEQVFYIEL